jgi:hypothetical protein
LVDDRRALDLKNVINEVAEILDPKKLLWTVRLGKEIAKARPTGMLEEFLGKDLTTQIWGPAATQQPIAADAPQEARG